MTVTSFLATIADERSSIARLTVYHLGRLIASYSAIAPDSLEKHPLTKIFHEDGAAIDRVLGLLASLDTGEDASASINARWGFVFEAADGSRVGTAYLDRFGSALSDGERVYALTNSESVMAELRASYGEDGVIE